MKKLLYALLGLILLVGLIVAGGIMYLKNAFPVDIAVEDVTVEATPERLERGAYLVNHVTVCLDCHSSKNYEYFSAPIIPGTEGKGGDVFPGVPGALYTTNITPAALRDWSDGEVMRAITCGLDKDNQPLAPMMPFSEYRYLAKEDVYAIVAYLRTLKPIKNSSPIPEPQINFPVSLIFRTIPGAADPQPLPDSSDTIASGKYLSLIHI